MSNHVSWQGFQRGVNLGGWFSQCDYSEKRFSQFIREEDIIRIAGWGLDHVRLPIDYNLVLGNDGTWSEAGFQYLENAVKWCRKEHLHLVVDLHKTMGFSFDQGEHQTGFFEDAGLQESFYRLWEKLASRLEPWHDMLAFELLNEVTDKAYADAWNRISNECIIRIRRIAPEVPILVGGYWNNSIDALPDLALPYDSNIIYNFHCYDPIIFTHQGAPWVRGMNTEFRFSLSQPVERLRQETAAFIGSDTQEFSGLEMEKPLSADYFVRKFERAARIAQERHVRLYCGEYGVIDRASSEDVLSWYRAIHEAFETFGISRAAWSYREMDFGLTDSRLDSVRDQLIRLL